MASTDTTFLRIASTIHYLAAIGYIFVSPLLLYVGIFDSPNYAWLLFLLSLTGGILMVVQAGLLANAEKKSTLIAAILSAIFLTMNFIVSKPFFITEIGLGISAFTLLYLLMAKSKLNPSK